MLERVSAFSSEQQERFMFKLPKRENKFTKEKQTLKDAVPQGIIEHSNWHWDPNKKDHKDADTYIGNVDYDWKRLEAWALDYAEKSGSPQRWFRIDREKGIIYHSNEVVNGMPYHKQAQLLFDSNDYNEFNTQYYKMKDKDLAEHFEPLWDMMDMKDQNMSLFVQMPGHTIPVHADVYSSFIRLNPDTFKDGKITADDWEQADAWSDFSKMRRYTLFVNDWDWGQFYQQGNNCLSQWKAGDLWQIPMGLVHSSANAGINPKLTFHWSGNMDADKSAAGDIKFTSTGPLYEEFINGKSA